MNPTTFRAVRNNSSNHKWQSVFNTHWPAYKQWYESKKQDRINAGELAIAVKKLKSTMPEIMPIYEQLCERVNGDPVAMQFLTLYQPPAYLINCSQAVFFDEEPILIRNYDLSPDLSENTILYTNWQDRKVMATNECLWGADDGINDAGLAISLTFGGRKDVGSGFGIPLIMRYVLQTCETVGQAITQLKRIPSHMAYNVTLVDKSADFATVMVAPDQAAVVTKQGVATNHQEKILWPEQASFSKTVQRKKHLESVLKQAGLDERMLVNEFHRSPLYSTQYGQSFGTVYTAVYKPLSGAMAYHWPNEKWMHRFDRFNESEKVIELGKPLIEVNKPENPTESQSIEKQMPAQLSDLSIVDVDEVFSNQSYSQDAFVSDVIPAAGMNQLEDLFDYIPEQFVANKSAHKKLKKELQSSGQMSWTQFAMSMQQLWQ